MAWETEDVLANPSQGDLLADTGALPLGLQPFNVIVWGDSAGGLVEIAQRNAANNADIHSQVVSVNNSTIAVSVPLSIALNQRVVVRMADNYSGQIQASIIW